jgi:hypothetical protein
MARRLLPRLGALALLAALAAPGGAAAAEYDAPHVDPDSPAGTEYQLPTDPARRQAGTGRSTGSSGAAAGAAPLFGAGVEGPASAPAPAPAPSRAGTAPRPRARRGARRSSGSRGRPAAVAGAEPGAARTAIDAIRAQAPAPDGGAGGVAAIGGGAAGVLLLGGLGGLAWRRRSTGR